jgi:murein DD-endopeptidase MepM/ murein hydrolase activator NlpD
LRGLGGVYNDKNLNLYHYAGWNPIKYYDADGNDTRPGEGKITSGYGYRTGTYEGAHKAVDIANRNGGDVVAFRNGVVIKVRQNEGDTANAVTIMYDKKDGEEQTYGSYSHTQSNLKEGDRVIEGQKIGETDKSGRGDGGHVHYEKRDVSGQLVDPTSDIQNASPYPQNTPANPGDDNFIGPPAPSSD